MAKSPPTGWSKRLPLPVEVLAGKTRKKLRTLGDVRNYMDEELPPDVKRRRPWQRVAGALADAVEGRRQTADVEVAVRTAQLASESTKPRSD